ncbi:MAG: T9SS type A sorting domain-containing protein [candidate division WOR-3 bacterium]
MTGCILSMCMFNLWVCGSAVRAENLVSNPVVLTPTRVSGDYRPFYLPGVETLKVDDGVMAGEDIIAGGYEIMVAIQLPVSKAGQITTLLYYPGNANQAYAPLDWYVWNDDGTGGSPGTVLASGRKTDLTYYAWNPIDVSAYGISINPGYVYVGWSNTNFDLLYSTGYDAHQDGHIYFYGPDGWWEGAFRGDLMIRAVLQTTDVAEGEASKPVSFRVYPNPSDGLVSFTISGAEKGILSIYDASGRTVLETDFYMTKNVILDPGVYFYLLSAGDQACSGRLMIR